jgi:prolyl oligopeptidase
MTSRKLTNLLPALLLPLLLAAPAGAQLAYPATRATDTADTYFGVTYKDPYRWLEDLKSPEVDAWFKAQGALTDSVLGKIPGSEAMAQEWLALAKLKPAVYSSIDFESGRVFYKKTLGSENVGKLYMREGWDGAEKLLFDPSTYKAGVTTTLERIVPSPDGRLIALGLTSGGAEWSEIRILDVGKDTLLPESVFPSFGPSSWTLDSSAIFYDTSKVTDTKSADIQLNRQVAFHRVGTPFSSDTLVFGSAPSPELALLPKDIPGVYMDETYPDLVFAYVEAGGHELNMFYAPASDLAKPKVDWKVLCRPADLIVTDVEFFGGYAYGVSHDGAPHYKLVRTSLAHPDWKHAETVIAEAADSIDGMGKSENQLFVTYSNGITGRIVKIDLPTGAQSAVALPGSGTVSVRCPDAKSNRCIIYLTSWISPTTLFDYDGDSGSLRKSIFNSDVTYPGFDRLVTEEVEVPGEDGTMIPLSLIHLKDMPRDGSSCCVLEGYGAYGISYTPYFTVMRSMALKGVLVGYAHVRGGGEKGESWYKGGFKATKPNTWKDFIACADYLVKQGYTSSAKLGGVGTSAGGILITRAVTERPDLFRAAVVNVGMANAMRSEFSANGPVNTVEFGTVKDAEGCKELFGMDGVHHVVAGTAYPAILGVCGWSDRRVPPWEPGKFVATVQNLGAPGRPVLLKVNYDNGHFTEEKVVALRNFAAQYAFLLWQEGHKDFQPAL